MSEAYMPGMLPGYGAGREVRDGEGAEDYASLLTLVPDRSLLPEKAERWAYGALSREAAGLENIGRWDVAAACWEAAARKAVGENFAWCQARMAWCLRRAREATTAAGMHMPLARTGASQWS